LVEVMFSVSISTMVLVVVMSSFLWSIKQTTLCMKRGWSQRAAMVTSTKITTYARNASQIHSIDEQNGNWVKLLFPDGSISELTYINPNTSQRDGNLRLIKWSQNNSRVWEEQVIVSGMMAVPNRGGEGYSEHVFSGEPGGANLNVAYWISEPNHTGERSAADENYAVSVRFSVCLRNNPALSRES